MTTDVWTADDDAALARVTSDFNALTTRKKAIQTANLAALEPVVQAIANNYLGPNALADVVEVQAMTGAILAHACDLCTALQPFATTS